MRINVIAAIIFISAFYSQLITAQNVSPATAMQAYLNNGDKTFRWELKESFSVGDTKAYNLLLTSQQWHEFVWTHQLTILVPAENSYDGAMLFITGGSNKKGMPNWNGKDDSFLKSLSTIATKNKGIVAVLRQTPNQPLFNDLTEDALISYTLHQFKEDGDYSWPLLFPMVKGAVRAMDAVQEFAKQNLRHEVERFVVTGASKRGWTTWLTGANDKRVAAIAPMVIDILNMPVNLEYQVKMWKEYSVQIEDYVKLGIPQTATTEKGQAITAMVDPYSYRKNLTMPKLLIMGTNDEYWTVDAIKHYIDSIPGQNFVHYVPNVGHDLGDGKQALTALSAFFGETLAKKPYAICNPELTFSKKGISLKVKTSSDILVDAILWSTNSPDTDFRNDKWEGKSLGLKKKTPVVSSMQPFPPSGYRAFYLDLKYKDPNGGEYTESTRMYVADNDEVFIK
ncbi:MAG TPA: PhoPQ-activated protein PqaA family protein [Chryseolinea sp.]|nr:PhoPQ-activated protein PqaA family protein [Chryseolinea sp.]